MSGNGTFFFFFPLIRNMPQFVFQGDIEVLLLTGGQKEDAWIFPFGEQANHCLYTLGFLGQLSVLHHRRGRGNPPPPTLTVQLQWSIPFPLFLSKAKKTLPPVLPSTSLRTFHIHAYALSSNTLFFSASPRVIYPLVLQLAPSLKVSPSLVN